MVQGINTNVTTTTSTTGDVTTDTQPKNEEYAVKFKTQDDYQNELNRVVGSRLERTKESIAKELGLESYSDEALKTFVTSSKANADKVSELEKQLATSKNELFDRDLTIEAQKIGVTTENLSRVNRLVKDEMQTNSELTMQDSLQRIVDDFPMFKGQTTTQQKAGIETRTDTTAPNEVDAYMSKYKGSKYYRK